jgi:predicted acyl esterase
MRWRAFAAAALVMAGLAGCLDDGTSTADTDASPPPVAGQVEIGGTANLTATAVPEGEYDFEGPFSRVLEPGTLKIKAAERVVVASDIDGADILMGLHLPQTDEKVPVLLFASPYFGFTLGTNDVTDRGGSFGSLVENFVPHGYAVVGLAIRGTGGAGGCNDLMGPQETADIDQAVTWLGTQPWSNGNVAMTGVSYDGSTPWAAATTGNPHLKSIIPISGVPDMHSLLYRNGSSESRGPLVLNLLYYGGNIAAGTATPQQQVERAICPDAIIGVGLSGIAGVVGTDPTGWWQERNRKPHVEANYQGSVYSIQGLQDWNVDPSQVIPWVDELERQGFVVKQLLGQWNHAWPDSVNTADPDWATKRADWKQALLLWMDQELKGLAVDTGAPVQVQDDLGRWRNEANYPPRDAEWRTYHLTSDGALADEAGAASSIILLPNLAGAPLASNDRDDPLPIADHADFVLAAGDKGLLIAGLPRVHLTVTPTGPGGYMAAYLYDSDPVAGTDRRIGWTSMNLAFAAGGTERSEVVPGVPLKVMLEVQPMDSVIPAGHYLKLRVWVFTDGDRLPTLPPNGASLEIGHAMESTLSIPVIQRGPTVYFEPPMPGAGTPDDGR